MKLDALQTLRFVLAGTVAFPKPYPSIGTISFEQGSFKYARDKPARDEDLVVVHERSRGSRLLTRSFRRRDVAAIFVPVGKGEESRRRISGKKWVNDARKGEWFLESDVTPEEICSRLKLTETQVVGDESILRGIVYVPESRPVLTVLQEATLACGSRELAELTLQDTRGWCTCK